VLGLESLELRRLTFYYRIKYYLVLLMLMWATVCLYYDLRTDLRVVIVLNCCKNVV